MTQGLPVLSSTATCLPEVYGDAAIYFDPHDAIGDAVHTIRDLQNPEKFDAALKTFSTPLFKLGEIALLATVILHALNGIRLTMVDMGVELTRQRQWFWYFAIGAGAVLFLAGAIPMFIYGILRHH